MYRYLVVRGDDRYQVSTDADRLCSHLESHGGLHKKAEYIFGSVPGAAWLQVFVAFCDANGNYAVREDERIEVANVVEVICSDASIEEGRAMADQIGSRLEWSVHEDDH